MRSAVKPVAVGIVVLGLAACGEQATAPMTPTTQIIYTVGPMSREPAVSTPVTVFRASRPPRDTYWGERSSPQMTRPMIAAHLEDGSGLSPDDEYYLSFPSEIEGTSEVNWDQGSLRFESSVKSEVKCIQPPTSGLRNSLQAIMIHSRCEAAKGVSSWTHRVSTVQKLTSGSVEIPVSTPTIPATVATGTWTKALPSISVGGNEPGKCFGMSMLTDHRATYSSNGLTASATPSRSVGVDDGCIPYPPESEPCDDGGGGEAELRIAQTKVRSARVGRRPSADTVDRVASLWGDETVHPGGTCQTGGGATEPTGYWRCFTTVTYWVETGIILGVTRWCMWHALPPASLRVDGDDTDLAVDGPITVASGRTLRLIIKEAPSVDPAVSVIFHGDPMRSDEIVTSSVAADNRVVANAIQLWRNLGTSGERLRLAVGVAARVELGAVRELDAGASNLLDIARSTLERARLAKLVDSPRFGRSRAVDVELR